MVVAGVYITASLKRIDHDVINAVVLHRQTKLIADLGPRPGRFVEVWSLFFCAIHAHQRNGIILFSAILHRNTHINRHGALT